MEGEILLKLHNKLIALVSIVLISVLSLYSYFNIQSMKNQVLTHLENSATILAQSLEQSIITSGAMENRALLQKLVVDFNKVEGIHEVYVIDNDFKIIAHPEADHLGQTYNNYDARIAILDGVKMTEFKEDDNHKLYDVVIPVTINGSTRGAIEVELEFDKIQKMIYAASLKAIGAICITLVLLGLMLLAIVYTIIIRPLNNLVRATSMVAAGSFQPISMPAASDEIGQLIKSFNEMCISLQQLSERDKSSNPLTGLPGNLIIKQEIEKKFCSTDEFAILYADLDHFKEFNDTYGFEFGDQIIKLTAEVLQQALQEAGRHQDFVGHVGGDDFLIITAAAEGEKVARQIVEIFDQRVMDLNRQSKGIMLSISVAVVECDRNQFCGSHALCERAAELKKEAKRLKGSSYLVNSKK